MSVEFENYSMQVKDKITAAMIAFLYEAGGELQAECIRNSRTDTGQTKNSWKYTVDRESNSVTIGNTLENAIWEEFGTGRYAEKGGRSGYWVFVKNSNKHSKSPKTYTLEEAKRIVAIMRSKGLDAYYTNGKKPNHTLERAITTKKPKIIDAFKSKFEGK